VFNSPYQTLKKINLNQLSQLTPEDQTLIQNIIKRMSIFKVNTIQAQIILRDLIGMAMEHHLRGTSLKRELGDGAADFANAVYQSAKSTNWLEIILSLVLRLSAYFFLWFLGSSLLLYGGFTWKASPFIYLIYGSFVFISFILELIVTPHVVMLSSAKQNLIQVILLLAVIMITAGILGFVGPLNQQTIQVLPATVASALIFSVSKGLQFKLFEKLASEEKHLMV
jgi:hypothetical protein